MRQEVCMGDKHRHFSREFKRDAVQLVTEKGMAVGKVARELDIHPNLLHSWRRKFLAEGNKAFTGKGRIVPEKAEIRRLRKELKKVREERDIWKDHRKDHRDVLHSFHLPIRLNSLQHISHAGRRNADQTGNLGEGHPGLIYKLDNPEELSPVGIVDKYICLINSTGHYMVKRSWRIQPGVTRHGEIVSDRWRAGK
jgi:transposase